MKNVILALFLLASTSSAFCASYTYFDAEKNEHITRDPHARAKRAVAEAHEDTWGRLLGEKDNDKEHRKLTNKSRAEQKKCEDIKTDLLVYIKNAWIYTDMDILLLEEAKNSAYTLKTKSHLSNIRQTIEKMAQHHQHLRM